MDNVKNDRYYIQKIRNDLQFIVQHMKDVDIEELNANEILLDSMLFRMIQLSENAKKLSDEYKEKRGYIPWNAMYGLRNRIVHDYGNVDLLIRTSNEKRISNFLLWQIAYAELIFTQTPWPLFTPQEFDKCIEEYHSRDRRFGGLNK